MAAPASEPTEALSHVGSDGGGDVEGGRVVVIGTDPELLARLSRLLPDNPLRVCDDYLMALGDIGTAGAPWAIIGALHDLNGDVEETVAALRQLAPRSRLIAVAAPEQEGQAIRAVAAGFDQYLLEPISAQTLMQALGMAAAEELAPALSEPPAPAPVTAAEGVSVLSPADMLDPKHMGWGLMTPALGSPAPSTCDADLGDTDLVAHLIDKSCGISAVTLRLMRCKLAAPGLELIETSDPAAGRQEAPVGHVWAPVEFRGRTLGVLHAPPPATAAALEPWAGWLAHWLALEKQTAILWELALKDELTGVWNRRYFDRALQTLLDRAVHERFRVTLLVFDIDDFKIYNDRYGHAAGDDILRETARLMRSVMRTRDIVARIGGDEFAVIFWDTHSPRKPNSQHPQDVQQVTKRFRAAIRAHKFPKLLDQVPVTLAISGGLAGFPWDGRTPHELLDLADKMCLRSKRQGKNALTFGPGALREQ